jgi:F0F1-type ATP synthase membrane subunit c/vacuolar-type H+-ATPase subunit K
MSDASTEIVRMGERLRRLERANRALGLIAAALVLGLAAAWSAAAVRAQGGELVTSKLVLTDAAGGTRAILSVVEGFGPSLVLYGENGKAGAAVAYDRNGQLRTRLAAIEGSGPSLVLSDARRKPRVQLSLIGEVPGLVLLNEAGQPTWKTP